MGNANRDRLSPPEAATPNSPVFREWLKTRRSDAASQTPHPASQPGGGSGAGGYGLALIVPDEASRERIERIMRDIREREARRKR